VVIAKLENETCFSRGSYRIAASTKWCANSFTKAQYYLNYFYQKFAPISPGSPVIVFKSSLILLHIKKVC